MEENSATAESEDNDPTSSGALLSSDVTTDSGKYFSISENCENCETNIAKFHEIRANLQEQLTAAQELSSRYEQELSGERFYRKDLESKLTALSLDAEQKIGKCVETNRSVEERLELLANKQEADLRVMQAELVKARAKYKSLVEDLLILDRKHQKLLGVHREKAEEMREKCIELPQSIDQLQFLALQLREELIETRAAYEHTASELSDELAVAKEQLRDAETLLQESELHNSANNHVGVGGGLAELRDIAISTARISDNDLKYQAIIAELEHKVLVSQKERHRADASLMDARRRCTTLQNELDTCEAVQKDFVRLSQQLQIQLEKLRQAEKEVRWQFDEDVFACNGCDTHFNDITSFRARTGQPDKQHCRHCGKVFCNNCLTNVVACGPNNRPAHVCDVCYTLLNSESVPFFSQKSFAGTISKK